MFSFSTCLILSLIHVLNLNLSHFSFFLPLIFRAQHGSLRKILVIINQRKLRISKRAISHYPIQEAKTYEGIAIHTRTKYKNVNMIEIFLVSKRRFARANII